MKYRAEFVYERKAKRLNKIFNSSSPAALIRFLIETYSFPDFFTIYIINTRGEIRGYNVSKKNSAYNVEKMFDEVIDRNLTHQIFSGNIFMMEVIK